MIPLMFHTSALLALILTFSNVTVSRPQSGSNGAPSFQHTEQYGLMDELEVGETGNDRAVFQSSVHVDTHQSYSPGYDSFRPSYWFSFGDSYTETGFNPSGTLPSVGNPLGNPPYPGYTGGGGANWVDFLTTTYNRSLILTYNFAEGGATINSSLVTPGKGVSLEDEVNTFLKKFAHKPPSAPWRTINSLFSVWIGINDIGSSYHRRDFDAMAGARFFLFINVPPVDRSPLMLGRSASDRAREKAAIKLFNDKVQKRIDLFVNNHAAVRVWQWDSHVALTAILDNPTKYGFRDSTSYGHNPAYVWGNSYHPGSSAHKIFTQQISDILEGSFR